MNALAQFVEDLGGGLMLTGGERSFGNGGYFNSPLDEVLPVSMEMREEHRKMNVAIAIALDRSGSMMAPVRGGKLKMDLANLGTAECVRLLSPGDSVAVIAVDSSPHIIQPLTNVEHPDAIASKVLKIQSMGGGIFVYEALLAAGNELLKASQSTKHIILFSDAADSEEPGDYKNLLKKYEQAGITVSVIGLGTDRDPDAALLKEIARLGSGNIMFTEDAEELPRLFTEDTMSIARSSFVKKEENQPLGIPGHRVPDARLMGEIASGPFPPVDGFNLSYLKPEATLGAISDDEYAAPWSAFWYRGLGRCAALTVEVDGQFTGQFAAWDEYADYLVTHVRWLIGSDAPEGAYLAVSRDGQDAVVTLELDPQRAASLESINPMLRLVPPGEDRPAAQRIPFEWQGPATLQARFKMSEFGTYRPIVELPDGPARGPAVTLPYSPEFMPRVGLPEGREVLAEVAMISGGVERIDPVEAFKNPPRSATTRPLIPPLLITMIVLLLVEIAGRRLSLWERLVEPPAPVPVPAGLPVRPTARTARAPRTAATAPALPVATPAPVAKPEEPAKPAAASAPGTVDVLAQAKRRARQRK
jgi:hypothetical protein